MVAGVMVMLRLAPLPPKAILAPGNNVGLSEPAITLTLPMAVSESAMVKVIGALGVSSLRLRSAMALTLGASLMSVTVNKKVLVLIELRLAPANQ